MGGDLYASAKGAHMTNLVICLAVCLITGAIFFTCDRLIEGDYVFRPVLIVALQITGFFSAWLILFAAHLGIASALGLFNESIERTVGFDFDHLFFDRDKIVAFTCLFAGMFELIAAWCWWNRGNK